MHLVRASPNQRDQPWRRLPTQGKRLLTLRGQSAAPPDTGASSPDTAGPAGVTTSDTVTQAGVLGTSSLSSLANWNLDLSHVMAMDADEAMLLNDITPLAHLFVGDSYVTSLPPDDSLTQLKTVQPDCSPDRNYALDAGFVPHVLFVIGCAGAGR